MRNVAEEVIYIILDEFVVIKKIAAFAYSKSDNIYQICITLFGNRVVDFAFHFPFVAYPLDENYLKLSGLEQLDNEVFVAEQFLAKMKEVGLLVFWDVTGRQGSLTCSLSIWYRTPDMGDPAHMEVISYPDLI